LPAETVIGMISCNSVAGRFDEWEIMQRKYVEEQIRKGSTYLVCDVHKTSAIYGSIAKHVPEGSRAAMDRFCSLQGEHTDLLLSKANKEESTASKTGDGKSKAGNKKNEGKPSGTKPGVADAVDLD